MQRDLSRLAELAVPHEKQTVTPVDVASVETERFADAQAGDGEQADQRPIGGGTQREAQGGRGRHHGGDVVLGV